jgi:hypothetical protein
MYREKHMKYRFFKVHFVGLLLILVGCASVPKESVKLSQEVGKGIASYHEAYINLLNEYFSQKRIVINNFILNKYLPKYMENLKNELKAAGEDPEKLHPFMVRDIVKDISEKRDSMHEELEKTRIAIIDAVSRDYLLLTSANSTVTGLLQSAVDVDEAASSLKGSIETLSGNRINFDIIDKKFEEYLLDAGSLSSEGISLYEGIKEIFIEKEGK